MALVDDLISRGYLSTPRIIEAFRAIKRVDFLPLELEQRETIAELDQALPIGFGQTISQPAVVAFMLELLGPLPGQKILDVGFGSGWTTALLSFIVSNGGALGKVIAIERVAKLEKFGEENIAKYGFFEKGVARCVLGDGSLGFEQEKPFDVILASASAENIPSAWREQLKIGGVIVAPLKTAIIKIIKTGENDFKEERYEGFAFVPLVQ